jgi:acetyl-CoA C-acetyltransferase/acetyl-CoA acyltransferase
MPRFARKTYLAAGLRTPFGRGGGALADRDAITMVLFRAVTRRVAR